MKLNHLLDSNCNHLFNNKTLVTVLKIEINNIKFETTFHLKIITDYLILDVIINAFLF